MSRHSFPQTLPEFFERFPDEKAAFKYLLESRWESGDGGYLCPKCGSRKAYAHEKRNLLECVSCKYQLSATSGTVMHRSKMPLRSWLLAAWLTLTDKRGISAAQLERQLGCSYETAYMMLQKLRAGMVAPDREQLHGKVEVDETYIGSGKRGSPDEDTPEKMLVVGAVEVRHSAETGRNYPARCRFRLVEDRTKNELFMFVIDHVAEGSTVITDGLSTYKDIKLLGYQRSIEQAGKGGATKADVLKAFHLTVSNLKAWLMGTHHGAVSKKHLQAYLNEYAFRFNRRGNLYAAFARVLGIGTNVRGPTYDEVYADEGEEGWEHPNPPRGRGWTHR